MGKVWSALVNSGRNDPGRYSVDILRRTQISIDYYELKGQERKQNRDLKAKYIALGGTKTK